MQVGGPSLGIFDCQTEYPYQQLPREMGCPLKRSVLDYVFVCCGLLLTCSSFEVSELAIAAPLDDNDDVSLQSD